MGYECFDVTVADRVAHVRLNRPDERNTLTEAFFAELVEITEEAGHRPGDRRQVARRHLGHQGAAASRPRPLRRRRPRPHGHDGTGRRQLVPQGAWAVWSPAGDGIALRDGPLIDPDTLARGSYGPGSALAYSSDGEHLLATGPGLLINDRRGCSFQLVATDNRGSPTFVGWAGTEHILIRVLPPA